MNTVEERLDQHERWIHQLAYCTSNVIAHEDDLPHEYVEDLTKIGYDEDHLRNDWTPPSLSTNPAPVVEGESMVHNLEPPTFARNHGLNERVAKLEAMVKGWHQELDGVDSNLGTHMHLPNGRTVFAFEDDYPELEDDDADATSAEWERIGANIDAAIEANDQPTPTEPEPGDDAKWEQVWRAHHDGGDEFLLSPVKAAVAKAVELGLVHREPVAIEVTQGDVDAVVALFPVDSGDVIGINQRSAGTILEAYAARLRARQEGV